MEWKNQLKEFEYRPPREASSKAEVEYCLNNIEKSKILANTIQGKEWLYVLDEKKVFDKLFMKNADLDEYDQIWMKWFIDNFIGTDNDVFKKMYFLKGNTIHPQFAEKILENLIWDNKSKDKICGEYFIILEKFVNDSLDIYGAIRLLSKEGMYNICLKLFMRYFDIDFILEESLCEKEKIYTYKYKFKGDEYQIKESWGICKEKFLELYADRLLYFAKGIICDLYNKFQSLKNKDNYYKVLINKVLIDDIEKQESNSEEDVLKVICEIICNCCKTLEQSHIGIVKEFLIQCLNHSSVLLRKIALKVLRESEEINSCEKFDIFIENSAIHFFGGKKQIFLLIASIFNDLTEDRKNKLIDKIENLNINNDKRTNEYEKYNWCVWIKSFCNSNNRINNLQFNILNRNDFKPRQHPELDMESSFAEWVAYSPVTKEEMIELNEEKLVKLLNGYNGDSFDGPSRYGMFKIFSECVKKNYEWTLNVVKIFATGDINQKDAWTQLMRGIQDSNYSTARLIKILFQFKNHISNVKDISGLSRILLKIVSNKDSNEEITLHVKELQQIVDLIWNSRDSNECGVGKYIDDTLNTTLGRLLISSIHMLSCCNTKKGLPDFYRTFFEKNLNLMGEEKNTVICALTGHFNLFCYFDKDWAVENLAPFLEGEKKEFFSAAWEGMVHCSNILNKNISDIVSPIYLKAVEHIDWIRDEDKLNFIDLYLCLLIYAIKNPCSEYIPKFYEFANENEKEKFVNAIGRKLGEMKSNEKKTWWGNWLKQYLCYRFQNKPTILKENEKVKIFDLLPNLKEVFEEAVDIIIPGIMPKKMDFKFLYDLDKSKIVLEYPHTTIKLITKMLNDNTEFVHVGNHIDNIYNNAQNLNQDEIKKFEEALLIRNINCKY